MAPAHGFSLAEDDFARRETPENGTLRQKLQLAFREPGKNRGLGKNGRRAGFGLPHADHCTGGSGRTG